jgi:hypothetical protein
MGTWLIQVLNTRVLDTIRNQLLSYSHNHGGLKQTPIYNQEILARHIFREGSFPFARMSD